MKGLIDNLSLNLLNMGTLNIVFISLFLATITVEGVPTQYNCGQTYQNLLRQLVTLKSSCDTTGFRDCCQAKVLVPQTRSGIYEIADMCNDPTSFVTNHLFARCDMETDGGKWLVIQRRINGSVNFYRNWTDYVKGFGSLEGEFWYGLDKIHCLTTRDDMELRIELGNGTEPTEVWTYQLFRVGGADTNYTLTIGQARGVGGTHDSMADHNGRPFSTRDRDNDAWVGYNCAQAYGGAWWYNVCLTANLNGKYEYHTPEDGINIEHRATRLCWLRNNHEWSYYNEVQMKIRPTRCHDNTCN